MPGLRKGLSRYNSGAATEVIVPGAPLVFGQLNAFYTHNNRFGFAVDVDPNYANTSVYFEYEEVLSGTILPGAVVSVELDPVAAGDGVSVRTYLLPALMPGVYNCRFTALNAHGSAEHEWQSVTVYAGIGRVLTEYTLPTLSGTTYYIDPTAPTNGNGLSTATPFNSWASILNLGSNHTYLQKAGTTAEFTTAFRNVNGICKIGAYGGGTKPKIVSTTNQSYFMQSSYQIIIQDVDVSSTYKDGTNMFTGVGVRLRNSPNSFIYNCDFHGFNQPILLSPINGVNGSSWSGCKILYTNVYDAALDGIYIDDVTDVEIAHCYIRDVNQLWFVNTNENTSAGDGIQAAFTDSGGDYLRLNIHHNTINRTSTGNKFCIIYGAGPNAMRATATIYNNHFIMGENGVGGVYLDNTVEPSTFYNNIFEGGTFGIHNRSSAGLLIHHNIFKHIGLAISNIINQGIANIYHNVFEDNDYCFSIYTGTTLNVNNNYFEVGTGINVIYGNTYAVLTSDNNHFVDGKITSTHATLAVWISEVAKDTNSTTGNPMIASKATGDYRPLTGSPLLGNGVDKSLTLDFVGNAFNPLNINVGLFQIVAS